MYRPMTEPIRGESDLIVDGKNWVFAPNGHRRPFDRNIRISVKKIVADKNQVIARWANQGVYTLRYDDGLADQISRWKPGSRHRVRMWGDRIEEILP